jgi:DNA-damage-inducible protein D
MKKDTLVRLTRTFEESVRIGAGIEYWMARDIQKLLEYEEWRNFCRVIEKAKIACQNSGRSSDDHFVEVNKMVAIGSDVKKLERRIKDQDEKAFQNSGELPQNIILPS